MTSLREQLESFDAVRQHLLSNSRLFVQRAVDARNGVAEAGWKLVTERSVVFTYGASRCVRQLLALAAKNRGAGKFSVLYIRGNDVAENERYVKDLRKLGIPTTEIGFEMLAHYMYRHAAWGIVLVGAEVVMQAGGILGRMGSYGIATQAKAHNIKVYPCVETHKFCRKHIYGQHPFDWKIEQTAAPEPTTANEPAKSDDDLVDYVVCDPEHLLLGYCG